MSTVEFTTFTNENMLSLPAIGTDERWYAYKQLESYAERVNGHHQHYGFPVGVWGDATDHATYGKIVEAHISADEVRGLLRFSKMGESDEGYALVSYTLRCHERQRVASMRLWPHLLLCPRSGHRDPDPGVRKAAAAKLLTLTL